MRRLWLMIFNVVTVVVGGFAMTSGQFKSPSSFLFWFNFFNDFFVLILLIVVVVLCCDS